MLSKDEYDYIKDPRFWIPIRQAHRGYTKISSRDLKELLVRIFGEDWRRKVEGDPMNCGRCRLRILDSLYSMTLEYEKQINDPDE